MTEDAPSTFSAREIEILELVATGATNQQIAITLEISVNTVKAHLRNVFAKAGVESRTEATLYAIRSGIISVRTQAQDDADALGLESTLGSNSDEAQILPPNRVRWPTHVGQYVALVCGFLVVLAVAIWPDPEASSNSPGSMLVDIPRAEGSEAMVESSSRWQSMAQMPTPRGRFAQVEWQGLLYVFGGLSDSGWSDRVEMYDPLQDRWTRRQAKPIAVANVDAAVAEGRVFIPGGLDSQNAVRDTLAVYDPHTDTWDTAAPLPHPLCAYAIAAVEHGFYLFGGWDGESYQDSLYFYDARDDRWQSEGRLTGARGFAAAATVGDRVYLIGGTDGGQELDLCESYDPRLAESGQDPWHQLTPMHTGRSGHGVAVLQGDLYVVGGGWEHAFSYNEHYDVSHDAWSTFESPIIGEWRNLGVCAVDTKDGSVLYAVGGWSGRYLSTVQAFQLFYRVYLP